MFSLQRTLSLGYLGQHPTRALLVVVSIALGVAMLLATQALNRGLSGAAEGATNPLAGFADLLVVNGQAGVPASLAGELRAARIEGVKEAHPAVMQRVAIVEMANRSVWLFGLEVPKGAGGKGLSDNAWGAKVTLNFKPTSWQDGLDLARLPLVVVGSELAQEMEQQLSDKGRRFHIRVGGEKPEVLKVGTVRFDEAKVKVGESVLMLELGQASKLVYPGAPGTVNQINVLLQDGASPEDVRQRIKGWLEANGKSADVQTVEASRKMVSDVTAGLELGFAICGAMALVVGLFLVYMALAVSVAERRHDIGILRSVGATRTQVALLFVGEAAALGLVGSLLGLPLGYGLAWLLVKPLAAVVSEVLVQMDRVPIAVSQDLLVVAVLSGTAVAVLAALLPALQAAGEEPADAVRRVPQRHGAGYLVLHLGGVGALLAAGFACVWLRARLPGRTGAFAGPVCLLIAGLVATPLLASLFGRVVQPFFRHFLGLEGRLAADNLVRAPGRTGLVVAALAATGGLMVLTAGFLRSTEKAVHTWVEEKIAADLFVSSGSSAVSAGQSLTMEQRLGGELRQLPGVDAVLPVRFHRVDFRNQIVFLLAIDADAFDHTEHARPLSRALSRYPQLRQPGKALVSENFAALHGVRVGDRFTIPGSRTRELELEVIGTVVDYTWNRGTILIDRAWYRREFNDSLVDVFDVYLEPGADAQAVKGEIERRWGKQEAVFVMTRGEVNREVRVQLQSVYGMAYAQQIVVGLVALLGVVSALFISVLQRRRELGLLRAVGASRGQVLRSVLAEAVLMGAIGAAVGFFIGLLLEWYFVDVVLLDESGFIFPMRVPWVEAGAVALLSVVCATLAGLWPAYRATRLRITEAIAYE
jgi:putative ABC transport system permease protein